MNNVVLVCCTSSYTLSFLCLLHNFLKFSHKNCIILKKLICLKRLQFVIHQVRTPILELFLFYQSMLFCLKKYLLHMWKWIKVYINDMHSIYFRIIPKKIQSLLPYLSIRQCRSSTFFICLSISFISRDSSTQIIYYYYSIIYMLNVDI